MSMSVFCLVLKTVTVHLDVVAAATLQSWLVLILGTPLGDMCGVRAIMHVGWHSFELTVSQKLSSTFHHGYGLNNVVSKKSGDQSFGFEFVPRDGRESKSLPCIHVHMPNIFYKATPVITCIWKRFWKKPRMIYDLRAIWSPEAPRGVAGNGF
ncbi:hypothetical protein NQ317_015096 [Molorchus minor]|uniref:Uncharacterized protein n=1 Tax=Molorchus minor TaxID=1323400 RepID=A0ABQ9K580_9CUCU|nr:hypothetical protein NQ317_015096 [Molorchus minor]